MQLTNSLADTDSEKALVKKLNQAILDKQRENKLYWLRSSHTHLNLASQSFKRIWSNWWTSQTPPLLEIDLALVFEDTLKLIDEALLVAVEVKYYRYSVKNFYDGLQQALAFASFGFGGLSLWHLFSSRISDEVAVKHVNATKELISGFRIPIYYLACKITPNSQLMCFSPLKTPEEQSIDHFVNSLLSYFREKENRNPLLNDDQVRNRRKALKVALELPV